MDDDDHRTGATAETTTLADVARAAGVSVATASKALNGRAHVSARSREAVLAAAAALSFTPNPFARALNRASTNTIGMLTSDLDNRFVLPILLGAEDAFGAGSLSVLLADARDSALREQLQLQSLLTRRVDGVLVVGRTTNPRPPMQAKPDVPVVYVYAPRPTNRTCPSSRTTNWRGGSPSSTWSPPAADASRSSTARTPTRQPGTACAGPPPRWRTTVSSSSATRAWCSVPGTSPGDGRRPAGSSRHTPTSTRSSRGATTSPAGSWTPFVSPGGGSRTTSLSSGSTTGTSWSRALGRT